METRVNYTAVGAFVVVLTIALVAGILWLTTGLGREQHNFYLAYVSESVSGLNVNAPVKYRGVDVGYVSEISLRPDNPDEVRLLMAITHGTPVKTDSLAILSLQGLTGIAYIDLTGGTRESARLYATPGSPYPVIETGPSLLARLDAAASTLFTNIEKVSDSLSGFLDEETATDFRATLVNIRHFTERLDRILTDENTELLSESLQSLHAVAQTLSNNAENLDALISNVADASARLPAMAERVEALTVTLGEAGDEFAGAMRETRAEVRNVSQHLAPQAADVLTDLRAISASLQRFVEDLENDPALLLHGRRERRAGPGER
ncbi:MAG: MCE family protein [Xanthomonadaceae bacterium]|nr:MCE family protein [Xanthomonadaceae bacterium]